MRHCEVRRGHTHWRKVWSKPKQKVREGIFLHDIFYLKVDFPEHNCVFSSLLQILIEVQSALRIRRRGTRRYGGPTSQCHLHKGLEHLRFWYSRGSRNQFSVETEGRL